MLFHCFQLVWDLNPLKPATTSNLYRRGRWCRKSLCRLTAGRISKPQIAPALHGSSCRSLVRKSAVHSQPDTQASLRGAQFIVGSAVWLVALSVGSVSSAVASCFVLSCWAVAALASKQHSPPISEPAGFRFPLETPVGLLVDAGRNIAVLLDLPVVRHPFIRRNALLQTIRLIVPLRRQLLARWPRGPPRVGKGRSHYASHK